VTARTGARDASDPRPDARPEHPPSGPSGGAIAAVIVNYESGPALARCATALLAEGVTALVVVDNGSTDGSIDALRSAVPDAEVVVTGRNLGYGSAANRGVAATHASAVLVCNPDVVVAPGALAVLADAMEADPKRALLGPLIRTAEGERYPSARRFPSMVDAAGHAALGLFTPRNPFTRAYQRADLEPGTAAADVDWVSGACFLVRRVAFEEVGGFDEAYFMYAEDVDLCWRLGRAGWTVAYVPAAEVTHLQGVSTDRHPYRMIVEHHRSALRFATRTSSGPGRLLLPLVTIAIGARGILACLLHLVRSRSRAAKARNPRL
jgi:N-acetylglucosaminyl-diphospho-decaprenol L-rhamnosyltransferase